MIIKDLEQGTPEWIEFRRNCVTATDIAAICNVDGSFKNKKEIIQEKLGHDASITGYQKKIFQDGHEFEDSARNKLNESGYNFKPAVVVSVFNDRLMASLDGLDVKKEIVLEVKSVTTESRFKAYCERIPAMYMAQVQFQLFCTGYKKAIVVFCFGDMAHGQEVQADPIAQKIFVDAAVKFLAEMDELKAANLPAANQTLTNGADTEMLVSLLKQKELLKQDLDAVENMIDSIAEKLIKQYGATKLENDLVSIQTIERQGSIDYKSIPEVEKLSETYLNAFRKKGTSFIQTKLKKGTTK